VDPAVPYDFRITMGQPRKSFGNIGDDHWTRTRKDANAEDIEYLRERSKAPGVAEGGEARNFYCMECEGVIPFEEGDVTCPHCGVEVRGTSRRYFNWVEIDTPPESDFAALLPYAVALLLLTSLLVLWYFSS
jgi:hypothetical protein